MDAPASPGPFGPELPFTMADLETSVRVAECLHRHRGLFLAPWVRPLRKAIAPLIGPNEKAKIESQLKKREREQNLTIDAARRRLLETARQLDRSAVRQCRLRSERLEKLQKLKHDQGIPASMPLIPDGPARDDIGHAILDEEPTPRPLRELVRPRQCYVCPRHFTQLHHFYDMLCPPCAALNYAKRHQTADLQSRVALVTGARVKIGFFTTLKLLRAGATVIATTRFPCDAVERYKREPQYEQFKDRLHLFGVDLRDLVHVHCFLNYIASAFPRLDMIIHNAAQTIRRPPQYYQHLLPTELALEASHVNQPLLTHHAAFQSALETVPTSRQLLQCPTDPSALNCTGSSHTITRHDTITWPGMPSALKSQIPVLAADRIVDNASFPPGIVDVNGQQVDLRSTNSWTARLGDIETPEVAEVFTVNAMAPFAINNKLLPMLQREINASEPKFIINVSAMEGQFNRRKQAVHPHTNMAKAALNMMTRTCAADLSRKNIFMNSVDTGWINEENPLPVAIREVTESDFQTPIDEIDAAARVLDPIFSVVGNATAKPEWGRFLKDYSPTEW